DTGFDYVINGLAGSDVIDKHFSGHDTLNGGDGDDRIIFDPTNALLNSDTVDGGSGTNSLLLNWGRSAPTAAWRAVAITIDLSDPSAVQTLPDGTTFVNIQWGQFTGGSGDDHLTAGALPSQLFGGDGNDVIHGSPGDDRDVRSDGIYSGAVI